MGVMGELREAVRDLEHEVGTLKIYVEAIRGGLNRIANIDYNLFCLNDRLASLADALDLEYKEAVTTGPRYVKKKKESE